MSETKRTKNIAFRLNDEEFAQIEKAAIASGQDPKDGAEKWHFRSRAKAIPSPRSAAGQLVTRNWTVIR